MVAGLYEPMARYPGAFAHWLSAAAFILGGPLEVVVAGDPAAADTRALLAVAQRAYRPNVVIAAGDSGAAGEGTAAEVVPLLAGRERLDGRAAAYVCRRFVCRRPTDDPAALAAQLDERPPIT
jgi:uncharacterized protein YyaL (SSP411 family)